MSDGVADDMLMHYETEDMLSHNYNSPSLFERSLNMAGPRLNLDRVILDDDYTAVTEVSEDESEASIERNEEKMIIKRAGNQKEVKVPSFDQNLFHTLDSSSPLFGGWPSPTSSSQPSSPLSDPAPLDLSMAAPVEKPAIRSSKKGTPKIGWKNIPADILRQPYGGRKGPARGVLKQSNRCDRSVGFVDKNNKTHIRLSKKASCWARSRADLVRFNTAASSVPGTPVTPQQTLPPASLQDVNYFDQVLATVQPAGANGPRTPVRSVSPSSAESSTVSTPVSISPRYSISEPTRLFAGEAGKQTLSQLFMSPLPTTGLIGPEPPLFGDYGEFDWNHQVSELRIGQTAVML